MKIKYLLYRIFSRILIGSSLGCSYQITTEDPPSNPNRAYFTINPKDQKIMVPVRLNDSITAKLVFDSAINRYRFSIDSMFCSMHPEIMANMSSYTTIRSGGSAWSQTSTPALIYNNAPKVTMGNTELKYENTKIVDWKKHMHNNEMDGMFSIPDSDTTNVWELNFEHNYLEVHSSKGFYMPENCFIIEMVKDESNPFRLEVKLAFMINCSDGCVLPLDRIYTVDTGIPYDIVLTYNAKELDYFNKKDDAVWVGIDSYHTYYKYNIVNATLFDDFVLDSLRIYTFDRRNSVRSDYLIGQNFLKRFNVFFDMKNKQIGLQPVEKFQRLVNPDFRRFHFSTYRMQDGRAIVREVADYKDNYYKTAGMLKGDEILSVNNKPFNKITPNEIHNFHKKDTLVYSIIRNGKPLEIVVSVDKNEVQGD